MLKCEVVGCEDDVSIKKVCLCAKHYDKLRKTGAQKKPATIEEFIRSKVAINGENGCWEAKVTQRPKYCYAQYNYESFTLHRKSYEVFVGEIPEGLIVRHKCDNSICANPEHLEVGTKKDNRLDFMKRHPKAKEIMKEATDRATAGLKRFWENISDEERATFIKNRRSRQEEIRKERQNKT